MTSLLTKENILEKKQGAFLYKLKQQCKAAMHHYFMQNTRGEIGSCSIEGKHFAKGL